jgi:hypothetical protein
MSKMNDVLLEQIERYEQWLISNRATGRTARLVDDYVQKFFNEPMNTPIAIQDHYNDRFSDYQLLQKVVKRLDNEYPNIKYEKDNLKCVITRTSMTPRERVIEEKNAMYQLFKKQQKKEAES